MQYRCIYIHFGPITEQFYRSSPRSIVYPFVFSPRNMFTYKNESSSCNTNKSAIHIMIKWFHIMLNNQLLFISLNKIGVRM